LRSKITHATGFSQWLMTNFKAPNLFSDNSEGTANAVPKILQAFGQKPDPPRKLAD